MPRQFSVIPKLHRKLPQHDLQKTARHLPFTENCYIGTVTETKQATKPKHIILKGILVEKFQEIIQAVFEIFTIRQPN